MTEALRLILLLALGGALVTAGASFMSWRLEMNRRLRRYIRRALGVEPDAVVIAPGRAAGAAISLSTNQAMVLWNGGARALLYRLSAFQGAELVVDDKVAARVFRGEPRRALDAVDANARTVSLRLVFDNPRDPDFDLDLWLPEDAIRKDAGTPAKAIQEARTWLARVEAILRMPASGGPPPTEARVAEPPKAKEPVPPWEDEDYEPEEPDLFEDEED